MRTKSEEGLPGDLGSVAGIVYPSNPTLKTK